MLQPCAIPRTRPWRPTHLASQRSQSLVKTMVMDAKNAHRPSSILSRLSDRTQSRTRRNSDMEQKGPNAFVESEASAHRTLRPRATSFVSARSAQKRDHAAEKWFIDVRELDVKNVDQPNDLKSLPRKKRMGSNFPKKHEMRPKTDLNALFSPSTVSSATSLRLQAKKELGGDYTSYLPDGYADPYRLPVAYARLVLGRNKHIPLSAQTGALNIVEQAIQRKITRLAV